MIHISAFADEISEDPSEQMEVLKSLAIHHIEFRSILGQNVLDLGDAQHDAFREMLKARRFTLSAIGSPIGKIKINDPFEPHLERFERALHLAEFYSCPRIRIFSYYIPEGDDPAQHRDEVMRRMAEKARIVEDRGVSLLLENEKGIFGDTASRVSDILETVNSPSLSHAFDPANYLEVGQDIDEAWTLLRPRVKHFHVKDYVSLTRSIVSCGKGDGQIARLIADAVANGYSGYAVLEPHLKVAAAMYGFTGPEKFGEAARALQDSLRSAGVPFDGP